MMKANGCLILGMALLCTSTAWAGFLEPPLHKPDWWKVPGDAPDGVTRTLYRSFVTDPELPDDNGDYTYNGFTPSQADSWTDNLPVGYPCVCSSPPREYGDGIGLHLDSPVWDDSWFHVQLGNRSDPTMVKEYFIQMVRHATLGPTPDLLWIAVPDNSHIPVYSSGQLDMIYLDDGLRPTLFVHTWKGVIPVPQPEWERFWFEAYLINVDSMWIGTHCIPEPGTLVLLGTGAAAFGHFARLRRKRI